MRPFGAVKFPRSQDLGIRDEQSVMLWNLEDADEPDGSLLDNTKVL